MADHVYTFRTALQGFNRSDVVQFIEATTAAHENALHQLQMDNSRLQQQLDEANAYIAQLQQNLAQARTAGEPAPYVPEELPPLQPECPPAQPTPDFEELELAAYRRAEQTERNARQRAAQLCQQIESMVQQSSRALDANRQTISGLSEELSRNIAALQHAMGQIRTTLEQSTGFMQKLELPVEDPEL